MSVYEGFKSPRLKPFLVLLLIQSDKPAPKKHFCHSEFTISSLASGGALA
jgi:hypothetical protein